MKVKSRIVAPAVAAAVLLGAVPAQAVTTFASFSPVGTARNMRWLLNGANPANATFYSTATGTATTPGAANVNFSFLQPAISPFVTNVAAKFTLNGTVTNTIATVSGSNITQNNVAGSFSILTNQAITIGPATYAVGSNLLSGTFTLATISGVRNATSGVFMASMPASSITYTSDFLTFLPASSFDFLWSLTNMNPGLNATDAALTTTGTPNKALRSFRGLVGGEFSSSREPITPGVPEPSSWMLLIAGFGMVGIATRRRKGLAATAA